MRTYVAVVERCPETGLYVGYVPGFPGAHTQAETLDELQHNLREVIQMLLEDGEPELETETARRYPLRCAASRSRNSSGFSICGEWPHSLNT